MGWDLSLLGLGQHVERGNAQPDPKAAAAWMGSTEGKSFMRASAQAWRDAHIASGEDPEIARGMAERTAAFYTGG